MSSPLPTISVVVPVYNGAPALPELVRRTSEVLSERSPDFEIILVNDESKDDSWSVIARLARENSAVRGVDMMKNSGQHIALLVGLRLARHDVAVTMDDDLQHLPETIPDLVNVLVDEEQDVVYGAPAKETHGLWRDLASVIMKRIFERGMGMKNVANSSAFRAIRKDVLAPFGSYEDPYVDIDAMLSWVTTRFGLVRVTHADREHGASNYSFFKLVRYSLNLITSFTAVPLHVTSFIGFLFTLLGVALLAYTVGSYFKSGGTVPGFAFQASIVTIFAGAQLFSLGIIGEYLAKIHFRSMGRPGGLVRRFTPRQEALASSKPESKAAANEAAR
ncbi:MAG: glycosyltransferase family 2 protein [Labilithrix sp.]|nr:glycosyltransferase family 2 protein [Labilithrix sp.]